MTFDPGRDVDQPGERHRVALGKAVRTKALDLLETSLRESGVVAAGDHPTDHSLFVLPERPVASKGAHRLAQTIGLGRGELGRHHGDLHRLLLKQGHAQGLFEHLLQLVRIVRRAGSGVVRRLQTLASTQIGMHHVALDRPRPDDRHLNGQIVEGRGFQPRQHVDLRPALHLKDPDGPPFLKHAVDGRIFVGNRVQPQVRHSQRPHQIERLGDTGQHPQRQNIDLHQPQGVDIVLVPFDEGPVRHGRIADGHDLVQPVLGQDEAADML